MDSVTTENVLMPGIHDYPLNWLKGDLSPTNQMCPNGSVNPPCRCVPQGVKWFLMSPPVAPASTARAITSSGSSTNNSTLTVVVPISFGSKESYTGWCKKN